MRTPNTTDRQRETADSNRLVGSKGTMLGDIKISPNVVPILCGSPTVALFSAVTSFIVIVSPDDMSLFATSFADINLALFHEDDGL